MGDGARVHPLPVRIVTEAEFQQQVIDLAHILGWRHLHVRRSIGKGRTWTTTTNVVGWPDLLLWRAGSGFVALELKVGKGKTTPEQDEVLASLAAAGALTMVVYPDDLDELAHVLRRNVLAEGVSW